ncbi:MAG: 4Fe-4S binding protein [Synergistetes bacterium]|nr:4Fe-4S binding protein [Synergistota bacterium]
MIGLNGGGGILPKKFKVVLNRSWCKACGICVGFCPKKVFEFAEDGSVRVVREEECIGCRTCEVRCPDYAIEVWEEGG